MSTNSTSTGLATSAHGRRAGGPDSLAPPALVVIPTGWASLTMIARYTRSRGAGRFPVAEHLISLQQAAATVSAVVTLVTALVLLALVNVYLNRLLAGGSARGGRGGARCRRRGGLGVVVGGGFATSTGAIGSSGSPG
ncbi:hypothetical protein PHK61_31205 [Actinomycetospora lutea]|uniref:hypothetical protein n=1 Tax=Actinomycetospora lutea TaxID=663604 RepID=UPI002365F1B8|nr:hypothetical protein [Actinomycetospora lutea]MDD7942889.1 hypothetical protein [Actinomycetospora lutea]